MFLFVFLNKSQFVSSISSLSHISLVFLSVPSSPDHNLSCCIRPGLVVGSSFVWLLQANFDGVSSVSLPVVGSYLFACDLLICGGPCLGSRDRGSLAIYIDALTIGDLKFFSFIGLVFVVDDRVLVCPWISSGVGQGPLHLFVIYQNPPHLP